MTLLNRLFEPLLLTAAMLATNPAGAQAAAAPTQVEAPSGDAQSPSSTGTPALNAGMPDANTANPVQSPTVAPASTVPPPPPTNPASPPEAPTPPAAADSLPKSVDLHGGVYLWLYQPLGLTGGKNSLDIYFAHLLFDAKLGEFGVHVEPRFRDKKLRDFFASNFWIQEAYVYWKRDLIAVKVGKVYSHFGRFWDNSFYGNLPYFDGFKLAPEQGVSLEASTTTAKVGPKVDFAAQYFVIDGLTNGSYRGGDTLFDPGSRRRNIAIANVEPVYQISEDASVGADVSGQYFQADLADAGKKSVYRLALGANAKYGPISAFGEYTYQHGQHVVNYPVPGTPATTTTAAVPGQTSSHNHYVWTGAELNIDKFSARYNFSFVSYADVSIKETIHEPGIGYALSKNVSLLTEFVLWQTHYKNPTRTPVYDRSLNFIIYGSF